MAKKNLIGKLLDRVQHKPESLAPRLGMRKSRETKYEKGGKVCRKKTV